MKGVMTLKSTPLSEQNVKAMMEKYQQEMLQFQRRSKLPQEQPATPPEERAVPVPAAPAAVEVASGAEPAPVMAPAPMASQTPSAKEVPSAAQAPAAAPPIVSAPQRQQAPEAAAPRNGTRLPFTPPETIIDMPATDIQQQQGTGSPAEQAEPEEPEYSFEDLNRLPPAEDLEEPEGRISRQITLQEIQDQREIQNGAGAPPAVPTETVQPPQIYEPETQYPGATDLASLQVQTFTAREALPVQGALVTITSSHPINGDELQYVVVTDQNGFTPPVVVPATDRNLTLTPSASAIPITSYDILVVAPGFFRVRNRNVPVYGGIAAVQPVEMIPIPEMGDDGQERVYENIPPQNL